MNTEVADRESDEAAVLEEIGVLLKDPQYEGNPLRPFLQRLYQLHRRQSDRLLRLVRISDGYHGMARHNSDTLAARIEREVMRLKKIARISDLYQRQLRELADALRDASLTDPLTGLRNRRYLTDRLREEGVRAQRTRTPLCIAIVDVDHFKEVNDRYGHDIGDVVLCNVARALEGVLREYDTVGRWGGEEFLVLLPDTTLENGFKIGERIRARIAELRIEDSERPELRAISLTASMGMTVLREDEDVFDAVGRADTALRTAKHAGRNCCHTA